MTITNYRELKSAVAEWLDRDDLENRIPDFINFAETRIHYGSSNGAMELEPLRLPVMLKTVPFKTDYIGLGEEAMPKAFIEAKSLTYYAKFPALVKDEDTNWLLTNHPQVYLFSALVEASIYTRDRTSSDEYLIRYASAALTAERAEREGK